MMTRKRLADLADLATVETPFTKMALDNLSNEEIAFIESMIKPM